MNNSIAKLIKYLKDYRLNLLVVVVALLAVSISMLGIGVIFRTLIDGGITVGREQIVNQSILYLTILIAIFALGSFFRSYFINSVVEKITSQIKKEVYSNILNFNLYNFEELKIGDVLSRLSLDMELLSKLIINFLSFFIRNSIMLLGSIILMFLQSPKLSLIVIAIIPLLLLPLSIFAKRVRALSKKSFEAQSDIAVAFEESVSNIVAIKAFNQEAARIYDLNNKVEKYLAYSATRLKIRSAFFAITIFVILLSITIVIWIGVQSIMSGDLLSGKMISFIYYSIVAAVSSAGIFEQLTDLSQSIVAVDRIFSLLDADNKNPVASSSYRTLQSTENAIEFKNLNFSYLSRPDSLILNNLSCTIKRGAFIGIAGRSGSGKSTMLQLILKFYNPNSGEIKIFGENISNIGEKELRNFILYIPQDVSIFSGTARDNILFAKPLASEEEVEAAAMASGVMDFVKAFKDGLDTVIGEKGVRLSGGQKQRIALSRAMLHRPEILLLDEAMSALDHETEQKLLLFVKKMMQGKTIISVAHRISSIEHADQILVIDKGKIIDQDTHSALLAKSEIYQTISKED